MVLAGGPGGVRLPAYESVAKVAKHIANNPPHRATLDTRNSAKVR